MEVIYLFYEAGRIRIPFFDRDSEIAKRLSEFLPGYWDRDHNQYILKYQVSLKQCAAAFEGRPFLEVGKEYGSKVIINGFFERRWFFPKYSESTRVAGNRAAADAGNRDMNCIVSAVSRPEKLSATYIDRLETELRSRKYSQKTINMYIHFNKALCKWLQKTPPEMTDQDIKIYMAHLDRDRKFSGSSMNLALSAIRFFYNIVLKRSLGL
ncbi:MAG: phage integrase N-terminal SAM-like domain-containing protein, partial [Treponema sp.]|nr:phage integrase N-terminal SAM-like domain-containing protein [Treponema sp.]